MSPSHLKRQHSWPSQNHDPPSRVINGPFFRVIDFKDNLTTANIIINHNRRRAPRHADAAGDTDTDSSSASTFQITPPTSPSPTCDVCGTRRLCIRCITQSADEREAVASPEPKYVMDVDHHPAKACRSFVADYLSAMAISSSRARSSTESISDSGSGSEWQEERRCCWGGGTCQHIYNLPREQGQSSLVTTMRRHLEEDHPDILTRNADNKYTCQWDGCQDVFATVVSVARHILTGKKHLDFGFPCPDCNEGSFRTDSLKIHRKRQRCRANKEEGVELSSFARLQVTNDHHCFQ
jgi:hypothetical protein